MIYFLFILLSTIALFFVFLEILSKINGDCKIILLKKNFKFISDPPSLNLEITISNQGKQQAIVVDGFARIVPEGDKFKKVKISTLLKSKVLPVREDGYFEAFILKAKEELPLEISISLDSSQELSLLISEASIIEVEIFIKYYGRSLIKNHRQVFSIDIPTNLQKVLPATPNKNKRVIPIKTPLIRPGTNLIDIIRKYAMPFTEPQDIVVIAETAVAISQGRCYYVDEIKPGYWAVKLCHFFSPQSSLSSPYSLHLAIREVGLLRIILAIFIGGCGKIFKRAGDFYRVAGRAVATIDDLTGTLPPYDKYVVLGPYKSKQVVNKIKNTLGVDVAIVDANDIGKVDILATTSPRIKEFVEDLKTNPQGNANEQTHILILKNLIAKEDL